MGARYEWAHAGMVHALLLRMGGDPGDGMTVGDSYGLRLDTGNATGLVVEGDREDIIHSLGSALLEATSDIDITDDHSDERFRTASALFGVIDRLNERADALRIQVQEPHPGHVDCADGCGLAVTHEGGCRNRPGGPEICGPDNHVEDNHDEVPEEPSVGSKVTDKDGASWVRVATGWRLDHGDVEANHDWAWSTVATRWGPVTLR